MTNSIHLDPFNPQPVFNQVAFYLKKEDLQALALCCKSLREKCYNDERINPPVPISLAKDCLDRFYPGYEAFKPTTMTYNQFYRQLQTIRGVFYAVKKGYQDGKLRDLKLSERFIKTVGPLVSSTPGVRELDVLALAVGAIGATYSFYSVLGTAVCYLASDCEFIETLSQIPGIEVMMKVYGISLLYLAPRGFIEFKPEKTCNLLNKIGYFAPIEKICSAGHQIFQAFVNGSRFGMSLLRGCSKSYFLIT